MTTPRIGFVGKGRVASGLGRALRSGGCRITGYAGRRPGSVGWSAIRRAGIILICVPDDALETAARALAGQPAAGLRGKVVLHTSGVASTAPLAGLRRRGASVGTLHPLFAFPVRGGRAVSLRGVFFAVDGDRAACAAARRLVRCLGGRALAITARQRPAYHLMATLAATGLAAVLESSLAIASRRLSLSERKALQALMPLARSVLDNVARTSPRRALTGPAARGDERTIARHLAALGHARGLEEQLYRLVSLQAIDMARRDRRLGAASASRMRRRLRRD